MLAHAATPQSLLKPASKQGGSVRMNGATDALSRCRDAEAEVTPLAREAQAALWTCFQPCKYAYALQKQFNQITADRPR